MLSQSRQQTLLKIAEYEKNGFWDKDVEEDPATVVLEPDKVDYLQEKAITRLKTRIANRLATCYYERLIRKGTFIIKDIKGLENYRAAKGGAVITCNHFHPNDNYAVWRAIRPDFKGGKRLYKVIKEGNYTNFGGFYGFMFRNCNTLPLSSNPKTMVKFLKAVKTLLSRGEKILVYPEQAMWWNYRKPRQLKSGAFRFAASAGVPVVPAFITMEDTEKEDGDGAPVQAYTVWFLPPIYPDKDLDEKQNAERMKDENYRVWKELYEKVYGIPLTYGE